MMNEARWIDLLGPGGVIVEPLGSGIFRLSESLLAPPERSFFYLVQGAKTSCLIDGGWGLCTDLLARLPSGTRNLAAIATHSHYDHIGHLGVVTRRYGHEAEADVFRDPNVEATQAWPFLAGRTSLADGGVIDARSIEQVPCPLTDIVGDGDEIDLGGRLLKIFHTPGHSPGSISLLDGETGSVFCGDVLLEGEIYDDIPGADKAALLASHRRLASVAFDRFLAGHGAIMERPAVLARMARYRDAAVR